MKPINHSQIGHATYNGHRLAHEAKLPDKGQGPYESTRDTFHEEDQEAWTNAGKWAVHEFFQTLAGKQILNALESHGAFLEDLEVEGRLDVGLPIAGTDETSYSGMIRALLSLLGEEYNVSSPGN